MTTEQTTLSDKWQNWKELPKNHFIYEIMKGRQGAFVGLHPGLDRVHKYIHGIQQGLIYLLGGDSGGFKTTLGDFIFVLNAWFSAKQEGRRIRICYCSFEVSRRHKEAKWCSYFIALRYGITLPVDYILGRIEGNYLKDDELFMLQEGWDFVTELMLDVVLIDHAVHPTSIFESVVAEYSQYGTVTRHQTEEDKKKGKKGMVTGYQPFEGNESMLFELIIDHLKLCKSELNLDTKRTMDKMSGHCITLKNIFKTTSVLLQQFSTNLLSSRRESVLKNGGKNSEAFLIPNRLDFGDSTATFENADVIMGNVSPSSYQIKQFFGYDCNNDTLGNFFLMTFLMKNRGGQPHAMFPLFVNPASGLFYDLPEKVPHMPDFGQDEEWVEKAQKLRTELARFVPIPKTEQDGTSTTGAEDGSNTIES